MKKNGFESHNSLIEAIDKRVDKMLERLKGEGYAFECTYDASEITLKVGGHEFRITKLDPFPIRKGKEIVRGRIEDVIREHIIHPEND